MARGELSKEVTFKLLPEWQGASHGKVQGAALPAKGSYGRAGLWARVNPVHGVARMPVQLELGEPQGAWQEVRAEMKDRPLDFILWVVGETGEL